MCRRVKNASLKLNPFTLTWFLGVANFCRDSATPHKAEDGLSGVLTLKEEGRVGCYGNLTSFDDDELQALDAEGRAVITQHKIK